MFTRAQHSNSTKRTKKKPSHSCCPRPLPCVPTAPGFLCPALPRFSHLKSAQHFKHVSRIIKYFCTASSWIILSEQGEQPCHPGLYPSHVRQCSAYYCEQVDRCRQKPVPFCTYCCKEKDCCSFVYYRYLWRLSRWNPEPEVHLISAFWPSLPSHLDATYEANSKDSVFIFKGKNCIIFFFLLC